jgi:hypothetical protein
MRAFSKSGESDKRLQKSIKRVVLVNVSSIRRNASVLSSAVIFYQMIIGFL